MRLKCGFNDYNTTLLVRVLFIIDFHYSNTLSEYNSVRLKFFPSMKNRENKNRLKKVFGYFTRGHDSNGDVNTMKVAEWLIEVFFYFRIHSTVFGVLFTTTTLQKFIISLLYRKKQLYFVTKKYYYINMYIGAHMYE